VMKPLRFPPFWVFVLVFHDGRLEGLLDYTSRGAIESTSRWCCSQIVFGLSTGYGVFLLARIKEHHDTGASARRPSRSGWSGPGGSSPPPHCCSRSRLRPHDLRAEHRSAVVVVARGRIGTEVILAHAASGHSLIRRHSPLLSVVVCESGRSGRTRAEHAHRAEVQALAS
jgi:hypothetical protein